MLLKYRMLNDSESDPPNCHRNLHAAGCLLTAGEMSEESQSSASFSAASWSEALLPDGEGLDSLESACDLSGLRYLVVIRSIWVPFQRKQCCMEIGQFTRWVDGCYAACSVYQLLFCHLREGSSTLRFPHLYNLQYSTVFH